MRRVSGRAGRSSPTRSRMGRPEMPMMLTDEPLAVTCVFSDGRRAEFSLEGLPNPRLARDLARGLAELVHPHGSVDAPGSVMHHVSSARHMVRTLAEPGFHGGA